jgi:hypothetical protein
MGTKTARVALLPVAVMFFAVLALDIAVPTLVLSIMALSIWLVTFDLTITNEHEGETA